MYFGVDGGNDGLAVVLGLLYTSEKAYACVHNVVS